MITIIVIIMIMIIIIIIMIIMIVINMIYGGTRAGTARRGARPGPARITITHIIEVWGL